MPKPISHKQFWDAIDKIASQNGLSWNKLAKKAKISASVVSPRKRIDRNGQERWITVGVLVKVLNASNLTFKDFADIMEEVDDASDRECTERWDDPPIILV